MTQANISVSESANVKTFYFIKNPAVFLLGFSMFMTGACGLVSEYVLGAVSTYILGNSIEQFSIIIALMLFSMGIAGFTQKYILSNETKHLVEKFVLVEILLAWFCSFAPILIFVAFSYMNSHFYFVLYAVVSIIGFLIGTEMPLILRLNSENSDLKSNLAVIFCSDYVGAFIGAMIWVYVLLRYFPLTQISILVAACNLSVAILTVLYFMYKGQVKRKLICIFLIIVTSISLYFSYSRVGSWSNSLEQNLYEDRIVFAATTKYQRLVVTHNPKIGENRLYINGNVQFSSIDEQIYHEQLVHPVMTLVPDHSRVLILGGGDGLALREVLKYPDVKSVTLVDLDPQMINLFKTDPVLQKLNGNSFKDARVTVFDPKGVSGVGFKSIEQETDMFDVDGNYGIKKIAEVQIINIDADLFVQQISGKWNVIIIDFPDPNSIELSKLYSLEFYSRIQKILAERGMIAIQSTSPYHAKEAYLCIGRTLEAAGFSTLPYHDNVPSFGDWGWFLCWKNSLPQSVINQRISSMELRIPCRYLTPEVFRSSLIFGKGWLTSTKKDVNTLMTPALLHHYSKEGWLIE